MSYVNLQNAPEGFDVTSAVVYPGFLTEEEGKSLIKEAGKRLKRRRFENGHWDSVITGYREVEIPTPDEELMRGFDNDTKENDSTLPLFAKLIEETRRHIAKNNFSSNVDGCVGEISNNIRWLPCHAIDLSAQGVLSAHVDSVKFSGKVVAGISLLSDTIMRLRPSSKEWDNEQEDSKMSDDVAEHGYVDLYLPQLSLYVLSGMSRYSYTHELLPSGSAFEFYEESEKANKKIDVIRGRRLSIIFRDEHCK
eukprot:CAMPEP_0172326740 /NCGR_PEP_ID=MMETSP1058-20130122/57453_1 /TAXON_ID=83371 /ORGANISM="Detonula confervacea, Strain CCMP 353" /LENGTH=250 /DNA_ID=CAMNT_0013043597 /DNA_START=31 /DNA_END=783 /DNA_ORIENTATION=-